MRLLLSVFLICSACAFADEAADKVAIEKALRASLPAPPAAPKNEGIWSELSPRLLIVNAITFMTPDVALVDAANVQTGGANMSHNPVLYVMRREGTEWRIATTRILDSGTGLSAGR